MKKLVMVILVTIFIGIAYDMHSKSTYGDLFIDEPTTWEIAE